MSKISVAIIGYGHMSANTYCPLLHHFAGRIQLAALVEMDEQKRLAAMQTYAFERSFATVEEMLADGQPDAALVLTPAHTHY